MTCSKQIYDVVRQHLDTPVALSSRALKRVLQDLVAFNELVPLSSKPQFLSHLVVEVSHAAQGTDSKDAKSAEPRHPRDVVEGLGAILHWRSKGRVRPPVVYTERVPLLLWTAVLPWETSRGLSHSAFGSAQRREVHGVAEGPAGHAVPSVGTDPHVDDGVDDELGVISAYSAGDPQPLSWGSTAPLPPPPTTVKMEGEAGMLFALQPSQPSRPLHFWSGAIVQPIDVAFIAPIEAASTASPSFASLISTKARVEDRQGLHPLFPNDVLSRSSVSFSVESVSHLDPFPGSPCDASAPTQAADDVEKSHIADSGDAEGVTMVLEAERHMFSSHVSRVVEAYKRQLASNFTASEQPSFTDIHVKLTLQFSHELIEDLKEKERLLVNFICPLEELITSYLSDPLKYDESAHAFDKEAEETHRSGEHSSAQDVATPTIAANQEKTSPSLHHPPSALSPGTNGPAGKSPPFVAPQQEGGVRADRSVAMRSPMLKDEDEGRPSYLAPSFYGRHDAGTLNNPVVRDVVKASWLARFPRTHSHMPTSPPIDYTMLDLCVRLSLKSDLVMHLYGDRMIREWGAALSLLRRGKSVPNISEADVRLMSSLARDKSLQLPSDLVCCIEAVARLMAV